MVMNISEFAETIFAKPELKIEPWVSGGCSWSGHHIFYHGKPMTTLAVYQATAACGLDRSFASGLDLKFHNASEGDPSAVRYLNNLVGHFNAADFDKFTVRVSDDGVVEAVLSPRYENVSNRQIIESMVANPAFKDASIVKYELRPASMSAMVLLAGEAWAVDGGLKVGVMLKNAENGTRAVGMNAMLFRLRCTNGAMDRIVQEGMGGAHRVGLVDLTGIERVVERGFQLKLLAEVSMNDTSVVDFEEKLAELVARRELTVGAAKKTALRFNDLGGGGDGVRTRWAFAQAISAAAREYSFASARDMSTLSGDIIINGWDAVSRRPMQDDVNAVREKIFG